MSSLTTNGTRLAHHAEALAGRCPAGECLARHALRHALRRHHPGRAHRRHAGWHRRGTRGGPRGEAQHGGPWRRQRRRARCPRRLRPPSGHGHHLHRGHAHRRGGPWAVRPLRPPRPGAREARRAVHAGAEPSPQRRPGPLLADGGDGPPCRLHRGDELQFLRGLQSVRVTATGRLETCLGHEAGVDLRAPLRSDRNGQALDAAIDAAIAAKPAGHAFADGWTSPATRRGMHVTGG